MLKTKVFYLLHCSEILGTVSLQPKQGECIFCLYFLNYTNYSKVMLSFPQNFSSFSFVFQNRNEILKGTAEIHISFFKLYYLNLHFMVEQKYVGK